MPPKRVRSFFDTSEELRRALNIRAAFTNKKPGEVVEELLKRELVDELRIAREKIALEKGEPDTPKPTRKKPNAG